MTKVKRYLSALLLSGLLLDVTQAEPYVYPGVSLRDLPSALQEAYQKKTRPWSVVRFERDPKHQRPLPGGQRLTSPWMART